MNNFVITLSEQISKKQREEKEKKLLVCKLDKFEFQAELEFQKEEELRK
jgi:hypothetical protein